MPVDGAAVRRAVEAYADVVAAQRDYLIELDAAIGDADHGANLDRGMRAVRERLADGAATTPAEVLKLVAATLISKVGGAAGPLYGTAFLRAATALAGKSEVDTEGAAAALAAALGGLVARGRAEPGDKTMVDAWTPAVDAARAAAEAGKPLPAVLAGAADAAEQGMRDTVPLVARKGRASYLGERSAGHQDPGATSSAMLLRVLADCAADC